MHIYIYNNNTHTHYIIIIITLHTTRHYILLLHIIIEEREDFEIITLQKNHKGGGFSKFTNRSLLPLIASFIYTQPQYVHFLPFETL